MPEMPTPRGPYKRGQRQKQGIPKGYHVNKAGRIAANKGKRGNPPTPRAKKK